MQVTYTNTFRDLLIGYHHFLSRTTLARIYHLVVIIGISFSVLRGRLTGNGFEIFGALFACVVAIGLFYLGLYLLLICFFAVYVRASKKELLTHRTITIDDTHVKAKADHSKSETQWSAIRNVVATKRHLQLIIAGLSLYIIPRSAFATEGECDAFYDMCRNNIDAV